MKTDELEQWVAEWQQIGGFDVELVDRVRRLRRQAWLGLIGGWCFAMAFAGLCGWLFIQRPEIVLRVVFVFGAAVGILAMVLISRSELASRRQRGEDAWTHLAELRRRVEQEIRIASIWWPYALLVGFFGAWLPWMLWAYPHLISPGFVAVVVGFVVGSIALTMVSQVRMGRKNRRKAAVLEQLARELGEG